jgi:hypothetical protein
LSGASHPSLFKKKLTTTIRQDNCSVCVLPTITSMVQPYRVYGLRRLDAQIKQIICKANCSVCVHVPLGIDRALCASTEHTRRADD